MLSPVSADDWPSVNSWWGSFKHDRSLIFAPPSISDIPDEAKTRHWMSIDSLWNAFEANIQLLFTEENIQDLSTRPEVDAWRSIDDLWTSYAEQQHDDLAELQELMTDLREIWTNEVSQFDEDPLTTNWGSTSQYEGPLRTTINEEDWSQWLAHLLRTSSGAFPHELLGTPNRSPVSVRREIVFFGEDTNRRVDILVEYEDVGVSIEVKQGDENYGKTPETAGLIEQNDHRKWSHILLLQKSKLPRLQQTFCDDLDRPEGGSPKIQSNQSADINVQYWQDVSRVLRWTLIEDRESDSHWKASAYLFITLIEQRILDLHPFSFVNPDNQSGSDTALGSDVHRLIAAEPNAQINYLRGVLHENTKYE
jgi:hypothetical protein